MATKFAGICRKIEAEPTPVLDAVAQEMLARGVGYEDAVQAFVRAYVLRAGIAAGGNAVRAARQIGVHRNTYGRLLDQFGFRRSA